MIPYVILATLALSASLLWYVRSPSNRVRRLEKAGRWRDALTLITNQQNGNYLRFFLRHRLPTPSRSFQNELIETSSKILTLRNDSNGHFPHTLRESIKIETEKSLNLLWDSAEECARLTAAGIPETHDAFTVCRALWTRLHASAHEAGVLAQNPQTTHSPHQSETLDDPMRRLIWQIKELKTCDPSSSPMQEKSEEPIHE